MTAIVDRRELEFAADTLVHVINSSPNAAHSFGLPLLQASSVRFTPKVGEIEVVYGSGPTARAASIPAEILGALLVSYCIRSHIVMPRKAGKGIRIEGNCVVLSFRTEFVNPPVAAEPDNTPVRRGTDVRAWTWVSDLPRGEVTLATARKM